MDVLGEPHRGGGHGEDEAQARPRLAGVLGPGPQHAEEAVAVGLAEDGVGVVDGDDEGAARALEEFAHEPAQLVVGGGAREAKGTLDERVAVRFVRHHVEAEGAEEGVERGSLLLADGRGG